MKVRLPGVDERRITDPRAGTGDRISHAVLEEAVEAHVDVVVAEPALTGDGRAIAGKDVVDDVRIREAASDGSVVLEEHVVQDVHVRKRARPHARVGRTDEDVVGDRDVVAIYDAHGCRGVEERDVREHDVRYAVGGSGWADARRWDEQHARGFDAAHVDAGT